MLQFDMLCDVDQVQFISHITVHMAVMQMWVNVLQIALAGIATWQFKTGASPWDRLRILPIFFLGSAELASGLVGL